MIRSILLFALMTISFSAFAQKAHSVFVDNRILDHFQSQVTDMQNINQDILVLNNSDNRLELGKLRKATEKVAERGLSLYHQMSSFLNKEYVDRLESQAYQEGSASNALELRNNKLRAANPQMVELMLTQDDLDVFLDNVATIQKISDELAYSGTKKSATTETLSSITNSAKGMRSVFVKTSATN